MKRGKAAEVRRLSERQEEMKAAATVLFLLRLWTISCARIWETCDGLLQVVVNEWTIVAAAELRILAIPGSQ